MTDTTPLVRAMLQEDVKDAARLYAKKRAEYEAYSPVFWRPAADGLERHLDFLEFLIADSNNVALIGMELDGALIGMPRGAGHLVDDFTVTDPGKWVGVGRELLRSLLSTVDSGATVTVVSGQADEAKVSMLLGEGFELAREWWIVDLSTHAGGGEADEHNHGQIIDAPPVYDPGGKVAMTASWDGTEVGLATLIGSVADEAVLLIVPVPAPGTDRVKVLRGMGATVASGWYERTVP